MHLKQTFLPNRNTLYSKKENEANVSIGKKNFAISKNLGTFAPSKDEK